MTWIWILWTILVYAVGYWMGAWEQSRIHRHRWQRDRR